MAMDGAAFGWPETCAEGAKAAAGQSSDAPPRRSVFAPAVCGAKVEECCAASWTAVDAAVISLRPEADLDLSLGADRHRLLLLLEVIGGRFAVTEGSPSVALPRPSHVLNLIPRYAAVRGRGCGVRFLRLLALDFDQGAVERMIDGPGPWAQRLMFADARLRQLGLLLAQECANDEPTSRLYADALSLALVQRLIDLSAPQASLERGGLPPFKLRRITEYMREHLGDDIGMQELAGLAGMSASYFSRAFKNSTGLSPHQWLILARCERAKFLLLETVDSLADIALELGFYDQAHFTRLFTQHVGVSPGSWRRTTLAQAG